MIHSIKKIYLLPFEADLQVMVKLDEAEKIVENRFGFVLRDTEDALRKVRVYKDRLPSRHRISSARVKIVSISDQVQ